MRGENFEHTDASIKTPVKYQLLGGDLLTVITAKNLPRIVVPPTLVGILLALTHLKGHPGTEKMIANMAGYYFDKMYTVTRNFVSSCYSCFLNNSTSRSQKIGIYPVPSQPFQEVMMDLAENLPGCDRYSHLLIAKCVLTDYTIIVPLKSKTAAEVTNGIIQHVLTPHNVKKLVSDNGPCFRNKAWLEAAAAFGITIVPTSALHPAGRGEIERLVQTVKVMMRKMLATRPDLRWDWLPYICAKILNNTVSPKTGLIPQQMVGGADGGGASFLESEEIAPLHTFIKSSQAQVERITREIHEMAEQAKERVTLLRVTQNERLNKTRIKTIFQPGDYVFALDRQNVEGNSRVLKTRFSASPWVVVKPLWTTTLIRRLADGFTTLYANGALKRFDGIDPAFKSVPVEIQKVLLHKFRDLNEADLATLSTHSEMTIPSSIPLLTLEDEPLTIPMDQEAGADQNDSGPLDQLPNEVGPKRTRPPTRGRPNPEDKEDEVDNDEPLVILDPDGVDLVPPNPPQENAAGSAEIEIADGDPDPDLDFQIRQDIYQLQDELAPDDLMIQEFEENGEDGQDQELVDDPPQDPNQGLRLRNGKRVSFK